MKKTRLFQSKLRPGFGITDLFMAIFLALLSIGLLFPAVQGAQSDAAILKCRNNLRIIGLAFQSFEKTHGGFPPRRSGFNNGEPYSGWGSFILPFVGEEANSKKYEKKLDFFDPGNKVCVETPVKAYNCPATADRRKISIESQASAKSANPDKDTVYSVNAASCDYIASNGVLLPRNGYGLNLTETNQMNGNQRQPMLDNEYLPINKITDGLSNTILLIEQSGRPGVWRNGEKKEGDGQFGMSANARGAWAGWGSIAFGAADAKTGESPGKGDNSDCAVNCNNWFGIYGFHHGGANIIMCDGSVHFVTRKLDPLTFAYLTIRDDGQIISPNDF